MRAVVDTNVWVSALLNAAGWPARVLQAFRDGLFQLVISEPLLAELQEVLARPRIARKYHLTAASRNDVLDLLRRHGEIVPVMGAVQICRDPDDDIVLETALRGGADVVVSRDDDLKGDSDLVAILQTLGIAVLSVQHFLEELDRRIV